MGQLGTYVTITGQRLQAHGNFVKSVVFGAAEADIEFANDTLVIARATAAAQGPVNVVLRADTGATVTAVNGVTYLQQSVITDVSPDAGQQGTDVVIFGERLLSGGVNITNVTLAGIEATIVSVSNDSIVVTARYRQAVATAPTCKSAVLACAAVGRTSPTSTLAANVLPRSLTSTRHASTCACKCLDVCSFKCFL